MAYTNAATIVERGLPGHRGPRRAVLRLRPGDAHLRPDDLAVRRPGRRHGADRASRTSRRSARPPAPLQHETHGAERRGATRHARRDAAAPALRLPDPQAALRPLHPRDGRADLRHLAPRRSSRSPRRWTANSGRERTTALVYSVGWTQHTVGVQYIRTGAILQLLLGNMGRPGGGIMALRGHASIQGSTDIPTLFNLLPGYLPMPNARRARRRWTTYLDSVGSRARRASGATPAPTWSACSRRTGARRRPPENDFCFDYLPRITGDHGTYRTVMDMIDGKVKGYFLLGQNPAVGSAQRAAAAARHGQPRLAGGARPVRDRERDVLEGRPGDRDRRDRAPRRCRTEVFLLPGRLARGEGGHLHPDPAAAAVAREGGRAAGRLPLASCGSSTTWAGMLRERLAGSTDERDRPLLDLAWDYPTTASGDEPSAPRRCCGRSTASTSTTGRPLSQLHRAEGRRLHHRAAAGSTRGVYADGVNQAARRKPRARADARWRPSGAGRGRSTGACSTTAPRPTREGRPWSERKATSGGTPTSGEWTGHDVPDFEKTKPPDYRPPEGAAGVEALARRRPVHHAGRRQGLAVRAERAWSTARCRRTTSRTSRRSATRCTRQQGNPTRKVYGRADNPIEPEPAGAAQRGLPVRVHREPADRAPHGGRR